jgi:hypothetical protein
MAEHETRQITEREIREAELQMTGRLPASATGFIGFVPAAPNSAGANGSVATSSGSSATKPKD